jgi:hypothetical protein
VDRLQYFAREAAASLLMMARTTSNPEVAAGLIQRAADLKERADELSAFDRKAGRKAAADIAKEY